MKEHDATEVAYKNGYSDGTEHIKARLSELYDDIAYAIIYYNYRIIKNIQQRIKNILSDL